MLHDYLAKTCFTGNVTLGFDRKFNHVSLLITPKAEAGSQTREAEDI